MQLAQSYDAILAKEVALWTISPQDQAANRLLQTKHQLPFPILADTDLAVIHAWGIFNDLDPKQRPIPYPATYIVGQDGRVAWVHLGVGTRDRPTVGQILAAIPEGN